MLEYAIKGDKRYYAWVTLLLGLIGVGFGVTMLVARVGRDRPKPTRVPRGQD